MHKADTRILRQALITIFSVLAIDQVSKVWVKLNMYQNEKFAVMGDWFYIHFLENRGMAFGFEFGGEWGKIALSSFRVVAVILIARYIYRFIQKNYHPGFIICSSMVLAGALGNIIDSAFYGLIFSESPPNIPITADFMPNDGGYAAFMMGNVVDMLHFPLFSFNWPEWVPKIGGTEFEFFRPVFNIADSAITVGLACIFIFQKRFFPEEGLKAVLDEDGEEE